MKRRDEELCKTQFDAFLKTFSTAPQIIWKEVAQQDEPPDYYLLLGGTKFAVEVTTLMEKVSIGASSPLPHAVISRILQQFVDEVEIIARLEGYLYGEYLISFPTPIDDFASVREGIQSKLLEYIRRTSSLETAPTKAAFERTVPQQRPQQCRIQKVSNKRDKVLSGGPVWVKWESDAAVDIYDLLNESLDTKADKLKYIEEPKILLLLDEYRFADPEMYMRCASQLSSLDSFHTLFVVQGGNRAFILHSQNPDWLNQ